MSNFSHCRSGLRIASAAAALFLVMARTPSADAGEQAIEGQRAPSRLLLLGQGPDGHPATTHEYRAGLILLKTLLNRVKGLEVTLVDAGEPWDDGPMLLDRADGVVLFLAEGARWIHGSDARLAALKRLVARGGGITGLHWGMGTREARYIDAYVALVGGCHGGPDRKFAVVEIRTEPASNDHPVLIGVEPVAVEDEFYYRLKFARGEPPVTPLLKVPIEGESHTVAWAWSRADKGRSFGFSGLHFHRNWQHEAYRRLVTQGIAWTMHATIPREGLNVEIDPEDLQLKPAEPAGR